MSETRIKNTTKKERKKIIEKREEDEEKKLDGKVLPFNIQRIIIIVSSLAGVGSLYLKWLNFNLPETIVKLFKLNIKDISGFNSPLIWYMVPPFILIVILSFFGKLKSPIKGVFKWLIFAISLASVIYVFTQFVLMISGMPKGATIGWGLPLAMAFLVLNIVAVLLTHLFSKRIVIKSKPKETKKDTKLKI